VAAPLLAPLRANHGLQPPFVGEPVLDDRDDRGTAALGRGLGPSRRQCRLRPVRAHELERQLSRRRRPLTVLQEGVELLDQLRLIPR
jgi:hypothetical protein